MSSIKTFLLLLAIVPAPAAGSTEARIVGGQPAAVSFTVSLGAAGQSALAGHFCGGSLIAPDAVLTAAHCVQGQTARGVVVTSGRTRLSDTGGTRTAAESIAAHPGWDGNIHDVAVIRLARPVTGPIIALSGGGAHESVGAQAEVSGWGMTRAGSDLSDELRAVSVPVVSAATCRDIYGKAFAGAQLVCAGGAGADNCSGDSGGPLVTTGSGGPRLIGIVAYGRVACGDGSEPGAYTRVSAERDWIAGVLEGQPQAEAPQAGPPPTDRPPSGPQPVQPPSGLPGATVRFGAIRCGPIRCRVRLRVAGDPAAVEVRRGRARALATRASGWSVSLPVPDGLSVLRATPLASDGRPAGRTVRVRLDLW